MGDVGDYAPWRGESQQRRAHNRSFSPEKLTAAGIAFTVHDDGKYLFVAAEWHFWPGTGKWVRRGDLSPPEEGRGVFNLINRINAP